MCREEYQWLASAMAMYPNQRIEGRVRLQKTIRLLQRAGLPTHYEFVPHLFGPYSESLLEDVCLLESFGTILPVSPKDSVYELNPGAVVVDSRDEWLRPKVEIVSRHEVAVLEIAATYDMFREFGYAPAEATARTARKKMRIWNAGRFEAAMSLLSDLGLEDLADSDSCGCMDSV